MVFRSNAALVAVHVQEGFLSQNTSHVLPEIHDLFDHGKFGLKIAARFRNHEESSFVHQLEWNKMIDPRSEGLDLDPVVSKSDVIVDAFGYSAAGEITPHLRAYGINECVVVGVDTDACVLATALGLFDAGVKTHVYLPGTASGGGEMLEKAAELILRRQLGEDFVHQSRKTLFG